METQNIPSEGWNKLSIYFKVISKYEENGITYLNCLSDKEEEFLIEDAEFYANNIRNSISYGTTQELSATNMVDKLNHTKSIYSVTYLKDDGTERTLVGYTSRPSDSFGYILAYDLNEKGLRNINTRGLISLIVNNSKYVIK